MALGLGERQPHYLRRILGAHSIVFVLILAVSFHVAAHLAHRFVNFHAAEAQVDAPALAGGIARRIVDDDGQLGIPAPHHEVDSPPGGGTRVVFTLPLRGPPGR